MLEQRGREELVGAISLGVLAERMVLALGRAGRGSELNARDREALAEAQRLFERMAAADVLVIDALTDRMLSDESYLDALRVVGVEAGERPIAATARGYLDTVRHLREGTTTEDTLADVEELRTLFVHVGEVTLYRANEISAMSEGLSWQPTPQPILRS